MQSMNFKKIALLYAQLINSPVGYFADNLTSEKMIFDYRHMNY